jgi:hypothetical protein
MDNLADPVFLRDTVGDSAGVSGYSACGRLVLPPYLSSRAAGALSAAFCLRR